MARIESEAAVRIASVDWIGEREYDTLDFSLSRVAYTANTVWPEFCIDDLIIKMQEGSVPKGTRGTVVGLYPGGSIIVKWLNGMSGYYIRLCDATSIFRVGSGPSEWDELLVVKL